MLKRALSIFEACANPGCSQTRISSRLRFSGMRVGQGRYCSPVCLHEGLSPGIRLGRILIDMKAVTEDQVTTAVAFQWSVPVFRLHENVVPEAARLVPFALLERYRMLP